MQPPSNKSWLLVTPAADQTMGHLPFLTHQILQAPGAITSPPGSITTLTTGGIKFLLRLQFRFIKYCRFFVLAENFRPGSCFCTTSSHPGPLGFCSSVTSVLTRALPLVQDEIRKALRLAALGFMTARLELEQQKIYKRTFFFKIYDFLNLLWCYTNQ